MKQLTWVIVTKVLHDLGIKWPFDSQPKDTDEIIVYYDTDFALPPKSEMWPVEVTFIRGDGMVGWSLGFDTAAEMERIRVALVKHQEALA